MGPLSSVHHLHNRPSWNDVPVNYRHSVFNSSGGNRVTKFSSSLHYLGFNLKKWPIYNDAESERMSSLYSLSHLNFN